MRSGRGPSAAALVAALSLAACSSGHEPDPGSGGDAAEGDLVEVPGVVVGADSAAVSPDGSRIVVPCDGRLCVWDTASGSLEEQWDGGGVVAWSAAGLLATDGVEGGTVSMVILDAATGQEVSVAEAYQADVVEDGPGDGLRDLVFSADGETVVGVGSDGIVRLWSVADPSDVVELDPEGDSPVAVAVSPDGARVAIASSDAPVALHDLRTGDALGTLAGPPQGDVAWSPDGATIATASFTLDDEAATTVWDAESWEAVATLPAPGAHLAFTPDSRALVVSEKDQPDLQVWDWAGDDVRTLSGASDDPRTVLVAPDGSRIYAVTPRDGVLAWESGSSRPAAFDKPRQS